MNALTFAQVKIPVLWSVCLLSILFLSASSTAQRATATPYDLGEITVVQEQFSPDSRFYNMPVMLRGLIAIPEGEGPFPVALFLHGAYLFCTASLVDEVDAFPCPKENDLRQFEGFAELAEGLAARGYLVMVPDLSAEYTFGYGEPLFGERSLQIIEAHLEALAGSTGFGTDLSGVVDLSRLVIASHSRGGPLSVLYATDDRANYDVSALAMLTPAYINDDVVIPPAMPTALVMAECDGDVGIPAPMIYVDEQLAIPRSAITMLYTLPGGTHNAFSSRLGPDIGSPCGDTALLDGSQQRAFASRFLPDFFDLALADYFARGTGTLVLEPAESYDYDPFQLHPASIRVALNTF